MRAVELQPVREIRLFRQADFEWFGELSGDCNPIHVDPSYAADTAFGATVAHGMLLFSAVRGLIARTWPEAELRVQDLIFPAPTYADEPVCICLEPVEQDRGGQLRVATRIEKGDGRMGLEGECLLWFHGEKSG